MNNIRIISEPPKKDWYTAGEILEMHWPEIIKFWKAEAKLNDSLEKSGGYFQKLQALKSFYMAIEADILAQHRECPTRHHYAYPADWMRVFTPIERYAWDAIRCKGHMVFYPQYPALGYFLDFANPGYKIAVELDGKEYHNKAKDVIRDIELKRAGWTIYRITGTEMYRSFKDWWDVRDMDDDEQVNNLNYWILKTGDGILEAIKRFHFTQCLDDVYESDTWVNTAFNEACYQTLKLHKS